MNTHDHLAKELLNSFVKLKHTERKMNQLMAKSNPSVAYLLMIDHLSSFKEVTIKDIKDEMSASHSAATQIVNTLEQLSYVTKKVRDSDKRVVVVEMTDLGKKIIEETRVSMNAHMVKLVEYLGENDAKTLNRIIEKMIGFCEWPKGDENEKKEK